MIRFVFSSIIEDLPGLLILEIESNHDFFKDEGGGHRWQRIPPNEKRGRVHTSTVTVAVIEDPPPSFTLDPADIQLESYKAGGKGGQHRNKTETAIRAIHIPTGITAISASERSQSQNKKSALNTLKSRIFQAQSQKAQTSENAARKSQIGCGARGDKIRTYRERDDRVVDHRTNRKTSLSRLKKGDWSGLK